MSDEPSSKISYSENPFFVANFRLAVPGLLGALVAYGSSISGAQRDEGKQLADIAGTIKVFSQITADLTERVSKSEIAQEEDARAIAALNGRLLVLEDEHRKAP